ncbi:MAG: 50S ribosomal protein L4 [Deltaproteobacteria bacterium]|nr:50S ribosomal protein L4 [Deltaproteobacteria bacterium]
MAKIDVVDLGNKKVGDMEVSDDIVGAPLNSALLWEVVRWQQAKKRQGTHNTKTRSEVHGTNKKPYAQKHTGRARMGDIKTPLKPGGAIVLGPRPRDYSYHLNKKVKAGALKVALSQLAREKRLTVIKAWDVTAPRTKDAETVLGALGAKRALLVDVSNQNLKKSVTNLHAYKYVSQGGINVYDLLKFGHLVITETALKNVAARLAGGTHG